MKGESKKEIICETPRIFQVLSFFLLSARGEICVKSVFSRGEEILVLFYLFLLEKCPQLGESLECPEKFKPLKQGVYGM